MIFQGNDSVDVSPEAAEKLKGAGVKSDRSHQKPPKEWGVCEATTVNSIGLIPWAVYLRTFHQSVILHWYSVDTDSENVRYIEPAMWVD